MNKLVLFLIAGLLLFLDQISKILIQAFYFPYQSEVILPFLNITLAFNTGSAFSFLSQAGPWHHWFFIGFGILMSALLVIWIVRAPENDTVQSLGFALILSGALGNLIDRLRLGYVIDFIDVHYKGYHWPVFNIADSAICIGVGLLLVALSKQSCNCKKLNSRSEQLPIK